MLLTEYGIQYAIQKAIKWSVLADHLTHQSMEDYQTKQFDFLEEDIMVIRDYETPGHDEGSESGS